MLNAAAYLYRLTGTALYYSGATSIANHQINKWQPVMSPDYASNGPFGSDQFFRGLANCARWNGLWSKYSSYFSANDDAAWDERRTDYNITHNDIAAATPPGGDIVSMEMESPTVYRQATQVQDIAVPFTFSGTYEFLNV